MTMTVRVHVMCCVLESYPRTRPRLRSCDNDPASLGKTFQDATSAEHLNDYLPTKRSIRLKLPLKSRAPFSPSSTNHFSILIRTRFKFP